MIKKIFFAALSLFVSFPMMAGGLLTNTNQSVHFLRNPARDAATGIEAVYTNPAGLTLMSEGVHFSITNQSAFQTRTITSTFAPYVMNGGSATKEFKGEASVPLIPSFQVAYKKNRWVASAAFAFTGGGGKAVFNNGLSSFESQYAMIPLALKASGINTTAYSMDAFMEGRQYILGFQLNGSYKISDNWSGGLGLRLNIVSNSYLAHIRNIMINPTHPILNPNSEMMSATDFFTKAGMTSYATKTANIELDCTQSGWGVTPILSVNYHIDGLNLAAKYEFKSSLNVENNTKIDDTGMYKDGVNTPHDIPALLSVGAEYEICKKWNVSAGYHHFFDSDAKMANDKQNYIDGGLDEYLFGSEYKINRLFLVSAGVQISRTAVTDQYQTDMSYSLNSYSVGFGGAVNITPKLRLNIAYFFSNYSDWTKVSANYNNINKPVNGILDASKNIAGTDVFARTNKVFGIGLDYRF